MKIYEVPVEFHGIARYDISVESPESAIKYANQEVKADYPDGLTGIKTEPTGFPEPNGCGHTVSYLITKTDAYRINAESETKACDTAMERARQENHTKTGAAAAMRGLTDIQWSISQPIPIEPSTDNDMLSSLRDDLNAQLKRMTKWLEILKSKNAFNHDQSVRLRDAMLSEPVPDIWAISQVLWETHAGRPKPGANAILRSYMAACKHIAADRIIINLREAMEMTPKTTIPARARREINGKIESIELWLYHGYIKPAANTLDEMAQDKNVIAAEQLHKAVNDALIILKSARI